jgi:hypothetical protein
MSAPSAASWSSTTTVRTGARIARNLEVTVTKAGDYRGQARFTKGTIVIQKYEPMTADMSAAFKFADGKIVLDKIDLTTDGTVSTMTGVVDVANWPEQMYHIKSGCNSPGSARSFSRATSSACSARATSPVRSTCTRAGAR